MAAIISDHNKTAASVWSQGGAAYNEVSAQLADALTHAVQRLWPQTGEEILEVSTATGWVARDLARMGANVTAIDIAAEPVAAARTLSAHIEPPIDFQVADAEALPFADGRFDKVISTFGVMFAGDQQQAANELARVCKRGGRLVLTTWDPEGSVGAFFGVVGKHNPAPPPTASPMAWGSPARVEELLGAHFDLLFEHAVSMNYYPDGKAVWDLTVKGFGPVHALAANLDEEKRAAFRQDFIDYHDGFKTGNGLNWSREYLLTLGTRK